MTLEDKTMQALVDGKKACRRCGQVKSLLAFSKHSTAGDQRQTRCKACVSIYMKHERIRRGTVGRPPLTPDQLKQARCSRCGVVRPAHEFPRNAWSRRGSTQYCRDCLNAHRRAYAKRRWKDPVAGYKARVRNFTNLAIRLGVLIPAPCRCGLTSVQAHHTDYRRPLEVMWLCRACHRAEHKRGDA
jgi:hypothetical protein